MAEEVRRLRIDFPNNEAQVTSTKASRLESPAMDEHLHTGKWGIYAASSSVTLNQCTLSRNSTSGGSGIDSEEPQNTITPINTIVAGNTGSANIVGQISTAAHNVTSGNPLLAPLRDYGGPTQTMPPRGQNDRGPDTNHHLHCSVTIGRIKLSLVECNDPIRGPGHHPGWE